MSGGMLEERIPANIFRMYGSTAYPHKMQRYFGRPYLARLEQCLLGG